MKSSLEIRVIYPLILNLDTRWKWVVSFTSRPVYPAKELRYELNRRPCGFQSPSGPLTKEISLLLCRDSKLVPSSRCPISIWTTISFVFGPLPCYFSFITYWYPVLLFCPFCTRRKWAGENGQLCYTRDTKTSYVERASRTLWPRWKYLALWLSNSVAVSTQKQAQTANLRLNTGRSSPDAFPHLSSITASLPHA
jgi:hypothetical protein